MYIAIFLFAGVICALLQMGDYPEREMFWFYMQMGCYTTAFVLFLYGVK